MNDENQGRHDSREGPSLGSPAQVALLLVFALVVAPGAASFLWSFLRAAAGLSAPSEADAAIVGVLVQDTALLAGTLYALRRRGLPPSRLGFVAWGGELAKGVIGGLALLLASGLTGQVSVAIFSLLFGAERAFQRAQAEGALGLRLLEAASSPAELWLLLFSIIVLAPLVEEIFFRGYAFQVLRDRFGVRAGYVLSAGVFAGVHAYLINFLPVFVLGLGFAWLFERSRSLFPAIFAHSLFNAVVSLAALWGAKG